MQMEWSSFDAPQQRALQVQGETRPDEGEGGARERGEKQGWGKKYGFGDEIFFQSNKEKPGTKISDNFSTKVSYSREGEALFCA